MEIFPYSEHEKGTARDFAAKAVGANPRYIQDAKRIKATAPELLPKIAAGSMSIPEAKREMRRIGRDAAPEPVAEIAKRQPPICCPCKEGNFINLLPMQRGVRQS